MKCDELEKFDAASNADLSAGYEHRYAYDADEVDAVIAELKAKLEDAKATAYADSVDAVMRERRLQRALWLTRAEKAKNIAIFCYYALHYGRVPVREIYQCQDKWDNVERKCLKKAEEYK